LEGKSADYDCCQVRRGSEKVDGFCWQKVILHLKRYPEEEIRSKKGERQAISLNYPEKTLENDMKANIPLERKRNHAGAMKKKERVDTQHTRKTRTLDGGSGTHYDDGTGQFLTSEIIRPDSPYGSGALRERGRGMPVILKEGIC